MRRTLTPLAAAAGLLAGVAGQAAATWSILIVDTRTGEIAVGSATCLTRIDLLALTPVVVAGKGAITAQAAGDGSGRNRAVVRDRLIEGVPLAEIFAELEAQDAGHQTRQYGMIDTTGGSLTFTGSNASAWAGGQTGHQGDLVWAVQGNILTGPNVVQGAVDAIIATPGDLADKLMAAMVAAREEGGDGRCSCAPNNATGCGSPPPGEFKSSHVGYMVVARLEDRDVSRGVYFHPPQPGAVTTTDLNSDGRPDIVMASRAQTALATFINTTVADGANSKVRLGDPLETGVGGIKDLVALDVTGDGIDDLVFLGTAPPSIGVLPGLGGGAFGPPSTTTLPAAPGRLSVDASGSGDAAVTLPSLGRVLAMHLKGGVWTTRAEVEMEGTPTGVALARVDADAHTDLVVTQRSIAQASVLRGTASGGFEPWTTLATANTPVSVIATDLSLNGLTDLVTANDTGRSLSVLRQTKPGVFERTELPLLARGQEVWVGDMNQDGLPDLVSYNDPTASTPNNTHNIELRTQDAKGGFTTAFSTRAGVPLNRLTLADTNGDGMTDIVLGQDNRGLTLIDNLGNATFPPPDNFAAGDYFMVLNVANTVESFQDPVDWMQEDFADWRASLEGWIDAVRSVPVGPSRVGVGSPYTIRVQARDWRGEPLDPDQLGAEAFATSEPGPAVVGVRTVGGGVVEIDLVASAQPGVDRVGVRLLDAHARVRLMPDAEVLVLADLADFNSDGRRDVFDIFGFLRALNTGDTAADLDANGVLDAMDVRAFLGLFSTP